MSVAMPVFLLWTRPARAPGQQSDIVLPSVCFPWGEDDSENRHCVLHRCSQYLLSK